MLYMWLSLEYYQGGVFYPNSLQEIPSFFGTHLEYIWNNASPTYEAAFIFFAFLLLEVICALVLPGPLVKGLPVPSENNIQHTYLCNAYASWYLTLIILAALHVTKTFSLSRIVELHGPMMVVSMITSDILSLIIYLVAIGTGKSTRMSGNFFYDYFMGAWLNPRIGNFDLKLWAEIRVAWIQLFLITLSAAVKQYETTGSISGSMFLILLAQYLYSNACMKGEECVVTTWDVFYEKWGWMLIYWNFAGVPYVYCFQSFYILKNNPQLPPVLIAALTLVLLFAYYIWDSAQAQKNRFRMKLRGTYVPRSTFPQLPWSTLENPKYLNTEAGDKLLIDGWWKYARKIHYTADITMASIWALSCGFSGILPYFYPCFFTGMITHRYKRDMLRCSRKYKKDWDKYLSIVKYSFIPGLI